MNHALRARFQEIFLPKDADIHLYMSSSNCLQVTWTCGHFSQFSRQQQRNSQVATLLLRELYAHRTSASMWFLTKNGTHPLLQQEYFPVVRYRTAHFLPYWELPHAIPCMCEPLTCAMCCRLNIWERFTPAGSYCSQFMNFLQNFWSHSFDEHPTSQLISLMCDVGTHERRRWQDSKISSIWQNFIRILPFPQSMNKLYSLLAKLK